MDGIMELPMLGFPNAKQVFWKQLSSIVSSSVQAKTTAALVESRTGSNNEEPQS